ncbi:hypothetical protein BIW11_08660 [Tropilaelaps mercedesae]|uniref:Uncharacterized protein n=1 Tax=Tropilaelaps mercedesae TaxID=418985 RepID=A0A1V9XNJ3_9ACAR|nr:hypothetical protein BIW11_08660 [Tropilaelaps mercedesae]
MSNSIFPRQMINIMSPDHTITASEKTLLYAATIETPTEIHVILETNDERFVPLEEMQKHWRHQKAFLSFLARHMNLGAHRRMHLHMNQQSIIHGHLLDIPTEHSGAVASSVACQVQRTLGSGERKKNFSPQDEATVLDALQLQLFNGSEAGAQLETPVGEGSLRPARVVIWLAHGSEQRSPRGLIKTAVERLKRNFKGIVLFFAVTTSPNSYFGEELFSVKFWDSATNKGQLVIRNRAREVARESYLAPLIAACTSTCSETSTPPHLRFEETVSENAVKVIRFGTEEFPNMARAQLTLSATNGIIKAIRSFLVLVCYDKDNVPDIDGWRRCTQLSNNGLSFRPDCQKDGRCESVLLAIFGVQENCDPSFCTGRINFVLNYDERRHKQRQPPKDNNLPL